MGFRFGYNKYVIAAAAWIGPSLETQAGISQVDCQIRWNARPSLRQVNLVLYFYEDSYRKEVAEVYWSCFVEVRWQWNNVKVAREVVSYPYELL